MIYELAQSKDFDPTPDAVAKKLRKKVTAVQVTTAIRGSKEAGLISVADSGAFQVHSYRLRADDEIENLMVRQYHKKMLEFAAERINDPIADREFGFVTVASTEEHFKKLKQAIKEFVSASNVEMTTSEGGTSVYQLNVQLFKLTD